MNIKEKLKQWREKQGMTQEQMATLIRCSKAALVRYESINNKNSRIPPLHRIIHIEAVTGGKIGRDGWFELAKEQS